MLSSAQLAVFVPAALAVAAAPGANNLLAFRNGLRRGLRPAATALAGRFLAFALMLGVVTTGLGALLHASQAAFEVLRLAGAAVMVGLGSWIVWSARPATGRTREEGAGEEGAGSPAAVPVRRLAAQEFVTAAANPKALLLFTAFLPPFVLPRGAPAGVQLLALGVLYTVCEAATALVWAASGRVLAARGLRPATLRRLDRASGGALVAFGGASGPGRPVAPVNARARGRGSPPPGRGLAVPVRAPGRASPAGAGTGGPRCGPGSRSWRPPPPASPPGRCSPWGSSPRCSSRCRPAPGW